MQETRVSLIHRVRDPADGAAWGEFVSIYQPLLTAYLRKRGVKEHDAADVVQDVFARLVPAMADFEFDPERGRFRSWLWRVTHNALADWARRRATRDRQPRVARLGRPTLGFAAQPLAGLNRHLQLADGPS